MALQMDQMDYSVHDKPGSRSLYDEDATANVSQSQVLE